MRYFLLLLLAVNMYGADVKPLPREEFTLTDGRTITGTYDEDKQRLTLDGGKMSLTITPDQIKERKPADPLAGTALADDPHGTDGKSMTAEEKAKAVAGFKEGKKQAAADALDSFADRTDKDAEDLLAKAKVWKQKAQDAAKTFQTRAALEGEGYGIEKIIKDPLVTKKTHANNNGIINLQSEAVRFEKEAVEKKELAKARRLEAQQMRGSGAVAKPVPVGPGPIAGPQPPVPGQPLPPGYGPSGPPPTPSTHP